MREALRRRGWRRVAWLALLAASAVGPLAYAAVNGAGEAAQAPAGAGSAPAQAFVPQDRAAVGPHLGRPVDRGTAAQWDIDVFADGRGLPPGRGTAAEGRALYAAHCASCHGRGGRGATAQDLAGATEPLTSATPDKTIGQYWPYATTLFDFIRRAKPMDAPGSLKADDVYALCAYLLEINGVIGADDTMDATTLPRVRMPNRDGFIGIDAKSPRLRDQPR